MARRGYVQLANGFYLNRKVRRLRRTMPSAIGAYAIMLSYCGDNLTDGYVDADTAEFVLDISEQELDALQQAGLVESVEGGYVVHDYLEHNRSRQQVMAKRKRERERYSAESLPAESAQTAGRIETESGQTPEHQITCRVFRLPHDSAVFPVFPTVPAWFAYHSNSLQITTITGKVWAKCGHGIRGTCAVARRLRPRDFPPACR